LDVTDALNILLWAANLEDGKVGYAVWDLFSPDDLPKLREFLWKTVGFKGPGDPVHSQTIHLTPTLLQLLLDTSGIRPFRIHQYPGEAVFIPAGYAHQVRCVFPG
jgi:lysine-specific demethylase 3